MQLTLSESNSVWLFDVHQWEPTRDEFATLLAERVQPRNPEDVERILRYHKGASRASPSYPRHNREDPKCFLLARLALISHFEYYHQQHIYTKGGRRSLGGSDQRLPTWDPPLDRSKTCIPAPTTRRTSSSSLDSVKPDAAGLEAQSCGVSLSRTAEGRPCLDMTRHSTEYATSGGPTLASSTSPQKNAGFPKYNVNASHAGGCVLVASHPDGLLGCDVMPVELAPPLAPHLLVLATTSSACEVRRISAKDYEIVLEAYHDFYATLFDNFTTTEWLWIYWPRGGDTSAGIRRFARNTEDTKETRRIMSNPKERVFPHLLLLPNSSSGGGECAESRAQSVIVLQGTLERFFVLWCLKESLIKALGVGLSYPLLSAEFRFSRPHNNNNNNNDALGSHQEENTPSTSSSSSSSSSYPPTTSDPDFYHLPVVDATTDTDATAPPSTSVKIELYVNDVLDPEWEFTLFRYDRMNTNNANAMDETEEIGGPGSTGSSRRAGFREEEEDPYLTNPCVPLVGAVAVNPDRNKAASRSYRDTMNLGRSDLTVSAPSERNNIECLRRRGSMKVLLQPLSS